MENRPLYRVGVDPAWKNLGLSIVREDPDGKLYKVHSCVMNPSTYPNISAFVDALWIEVLNAMKSDGHEPVIASVTIERFVAYQGVSTSETENICMIIGALQYLFKASGALMLRAIDWKTSLVKELFKRKGFENPSTKLDKKFSIAAAKACLDEDVKFATDHEADGTCLAAYPVLTRKLKK
jgi:hypothetical protein